jgi:hypothetical protein
LPDLATALGAQRGAYRNLLGATDAAGEQQVRHVRRGQDQEEDRRAHQRKRRARLIPDQRFTDRRHRESHAAIRRWPRGFCAGGNRIKFSLGLRARDSGSEPGKRRHRGLRGRTNALRHPRFGVVGELESGRQYAHDGGDVIVDANA